MIDDMPEEWRPIPDHPDYEVSSLGRVRSWKGRSGGLILRGNTDRAGYHRVFLDGVRYSTHRIVGAVSAQATTTNNNRRIDMSAYEGTRIRSRSPLCLDAFEDRLAAAFGYPDEASVRLYQLILECFLDDGTAAT